MLILGLETSCDETACAIVENGTKIISNVVASSQELHIKTKGVIPEVAAREQVKCIIPVIKETIISLCHPEGTKRPRDPVGFQYTVGDSSPAGWRGQNDIDKIDAIAVTVGPGLIGSLLVGVETAKTLAYVWHKPIIPVNHLIGHIYTNFVNTNYRKDHLGRWQAERQRSHDSSEVYRFKEIFPALVLIVSGGHTELLLMIDHGKFNWLGGTRDDAAGECFDKCARILGLPYPGGPSIEKEAKKYFTSDGGRPNPELAEGEGHDSSEVRIHLPRPMIDQENFDFSFSGLKTALLNMVQQFNNAYPERSHAPDGAWRSRRVTMKQSIPYLASEVQEAITDVLVDKTIKAAEKFMVKSIIIGGGVTANQTLREKFREKAKNFNLLMPEKSLSTDNAVGIASAAFFNYHPVTWSKITANSGLEII